jgi:hypothetical protein
MVRQTIIRGLTEKLNLFVSMTMLSIRICELSKFLMGNLTVLNKLKEANSDSRSTLEVISRKFVLKSPPKIMLVDILYNLFRINSR